MFNTKNGVLALTLALLSSCSISTTQRLDCSKWDTEDFFKQAEAADVKRCIGEGADIEARGEHSWTPLHFVARNNENPEVVKALLDAGADIVARDDGGDTPLHIAASSNENPEVVKVLLDAGADIKARSDGGGTPLHSAAYNNENPEVVKVLLDAGANIKAKSNNGKLPIDFMEEDSPLYKTDVYYRLNEARF